MQISILFNESNFVFTNLSCENKPKITSRDFGMPYQDFQDEIGGNLYSWLQQSYKVLWQINETTNEIVIFENTNQMLAERFATLLKVTKIDAKEGVWAMVKSLSLANLYIEKVIFKFDGNSPLKQQNENLHGLLKLFMFWLASNDLSESEINLKCLNLFISKFAMEIDLTQYQNFSGSEMMNAFTNCFKNNSNEVELFNEMLQAQTNSGTAI